MVPFQRGGPESNSSGYATPFLFPSVPCLEEQLDESISFLEALAPRCFNCCWEDSTSK